MEREGKGGCQTFHGAYPYLFLSPRLDLLKEILREIRDLSQFLLREMMAQPQCANAKTYKIKRAPPSDHGCKGRQFHELSTDLERWLRFLLIQPCKNVLPKNLLPLPVGGHHFSPLVEGSLIPKVERGNLHFSGEMDGGGRSALNLSFFFLCPKKDKIHGVIEV